MLKVLAVNGSPMMDKGNTALILGQLLEGMTEAGAEVELLYTKKLKINPCQGELSCFYKTPGKCYQDDDMKTVLPKLAEADVWVFASPVFWEAISGPLKTFIDRMCPLMDPHIEVREGRCRNPLWPETKSGQVLLVSNSGCPEMENFEPMVNFMKAFSKATEREFAGAVLRPSGGAVKMMMDFGMAPSDVLEASKEAGRQLVHEGAISAQTLDTIASEVMPLEAFVEAANQMADQAVAASRQDA
jgi:multimeric flavodoxin WrbA